MTVTHTKARIKDRAYRLWPAHVRNMREVDGIVVDVFSDGEHTYAVFPWNSAQDPGNSRGWRADRQGQPLWEMIKESLGQQIDPATLKEWRYRAAWLIGEPSIMLDPIVGSGPVSPDAPEGFISLAEHERRLNEFKDRVHAVASKHARENDWCNVVNVALEEMGIHKNVMQRFEVTLRPQLTLTVEAEDEESAQDRAYKLVGEKVKLTEPDADGRTDFEWDEHDTLVESD